jgi:pimeloyl-ACP methyl ester carboxylesterase
MGGLIGMAMAAKPRSPIGRLVLNDIGPLVPWPGLIRLKSVHAGLHAKFSTLAEVESHLRAACASFGPLDDAKWRHVTRHSARRNEDGTWSLAYDPGIITALRRGNNSGLEFGSDFLFGVDLWPVWDAVACPTLVLRGAESDLLSEGTAREMANRGPKARVVEFPGIGHAPWLMDEAQIDVVRGFLLEK